MDEYVNLIVPPEYVRETETRLHEWYKQHGVNSPPPMVSGGSGDGRERLGNDIPIAAVEYIRQCGIPCETAPRNPRWPLPGS
jgi:hypothetical protein